METLALIKLQRSRLERQLSKAYAWTSQVEGKEVEVMERVCEGMFASSVFTALAANNSITRKNEKYPIKKDYLLS